MITLNAKIDLITGSEGYLSSVSTLIGNNISSQIPLGQKKTTKSPFIIGASKLDGNSHFSDDVDYFIGSQLANQNGEFAQPYTITVSGSQISSLTIAFDDVNGRHPKSITIDGQTYVDDDAIFTIPLNGSDAHTIYIDNWNSPNFPLVITGIYVAITINIDKRNLISIERSVSDRAETNYPSWGVFSNGGSLSFNDKNGEIKDYAEKNFLQGGVNVEIFIGNTLSRSQKLIGVFSTTEWSYDNDNRAANVSFKDDLEEWQDIFVDGINYDSRTQKSQTMQYFYDYLHSKTPQKYNMLSFSELDENTQDIISSTVVQYPLLESGNLWAQWNKVCQVCGLNIYEDIIDNERRVVCVYSERGAV
jgi:hypothetical protein